jgi:hypothetical protein
MLFLSDFKEACNISTYFSETFEFMKFYEIPYNCFQVIASAVYARVLIASP